MREEPPVFSDRLNTLLSVIGANNVEIASAAGFDRTNISHMRSGRRTPAPGSRTIDQFTDGIFQFCRARGRLSQLMELTGIPEDADPAAAKKSLKEWLFQDEEAHPSEKPAGVRRSANAAPKAYSLQFGSRLDTAMNLADLSKVNLSRLLHVDSSLISRYRNGLRKLKSDTALAEKLSILLFDRIEKAGRKEELVRLLGIPSEEADRDAFAAWLFDDGRKMDEDLKSVRDLLEILESFRPGNTSKLSRDTFEMILYSLLNDPGEDTRTLYLGTEGFRESVLRFLRNAVLSRSRELFLYSDEDQSWLAGDPEYLAKWFVLMSACVRNGTQIRIIHNIDRNAAEMNDAIRSWLPLYMSGRIESYSSIRMRNARFSHTLFLDPGAGCIHAFHAAGTEQTGIYHYYTDPEMLRILGGEFLLLQKNSRPLLKAGELITDDGSSDVTIFKATLSIATMPAEVVESFHDSALTAYWQHIHEKVIRDLESRKITECISVADAASLRQGTVPVESFSAGKQLFYTEEQYARHLEHIRRLSETFPGYRFINDAEPPFSNIDLLISEDLARITLAANPQVSFCFTHPKMCRAFQEYASGFVRKALTGGDSSTGSPEAADPVEQ